MSKADYFTRKLTAENIEAIKKSGKQTKELAEMFDVSTRTIRLIKSRAIHKNQKPPRVQAGLHVAPKPMLRPRPCMCCRKEFDSEGNHNRLCCDCKSKRSINPYEVITGVSRRVDRR
jgi:hypothetical protein